MSVYYDTYTGCPKKNGTHINYVFASLKLKSRYYFGYPSWLIITNNYYSNIFSFLMLSSYEIIYSI